MENIDRKKEICSIHSILSDESIFGDEKIILKCPACGFENSHFENPETIDGKDGYAANWGGRGDLIVIPMWSECGHKWEICIGFHKGYSGIFVRNSGSFDNFDDVIKKQLDTIRTK